MRAVAYVWSSEQQSSSIGTQREACITHASAHGLELTPMDIFQGVGTTENGAGRPELAALVAYCMKHRGAIHTCVVWSADTVADSDEGFAIVGWQLARLGISLKVVSGESNQAFQDGLSGAIGSVLDALNIPSQSTVIENIDDPAVRVLLLEYATGDFSMKQLAELASKLGIKNGVGGRLSQQAIKQLLLRSGEPAISPLTRQRIYSLVHGHTKKYVSGVELDWPLRGLLRHSCDASITASAPRGRNGPSPRYHCPGACGAEIMSARREAVHAQFIGFLRSAVQTRQAEDAIWKQARQAVASELESLYGKFTAERGTDGASRVRQAELSHRLSECSAKLAMLDACMRDPGMFWNLMTVTDKVRFQNHFWSEGLQYDFVSFED